jgi:hypothetical protein
VQPDVSSDSQQPQKTNRLRKACDSCSIRKVKVSYWNHCFQLRPLLTLAV